MLPLRIDYGILKLVNKFVLFSSFITYSHRANKVNVVQQDEPNIHIGIKKFRLRTMSFSGNLIQHSYTAQLLALEANRSKALDKINSN